MISKELTNEVMGFYPDAIVENGSYLDLHQLCPKDGSSIGGGSINIHELAHMCKEWMAKKGYQVTVDTYCDGVVFGWCVTLKKKIGGGSVLEYVAPIETDAVFFSGQWILDKGE